MTDPQQYCCAKLVKDLKRRVEEVEAELDRWCVLRRRLDEEVLRRLTRLEELSFLGSLTQLLAASQKLGVDPKRLLDEALKKIREECENRGEEVERR